MGFGLKQLLFGPAPSPVSEVKDPAEEITDALPPMAPPEGEDPAEDVTFYAPAQQQIVVLREAWDWLHTGQIEDLGIWPIGTPEDAPPSPSARFLTLDDYRDAAAQVRAGGHDFGLVVDRKLVLLIA